MSVLLLPLRLQALIRVESNGCWIWTGSTGKGGYGQSKLSNRSILAHRLTYLLLVGEVPEGLELDHLCRVTSCVNPEHLEPVTRTENRRRAAAAITHCKHGHEYTPENTRYSRRGSRYCYTCHRERGRAYKAKFLKGRPTHCPQGHPYDEDNTYYRPGTRKRACRECARERNRRRRLTKQAAA